MLRVLLIYSISTPQRGHHTSPLSLNAKRYKNNSITYCNFASPHCVQTTHPKLGSALISSIITGPWPRIKTIEVISALHFFPDIISPLNFQQVLIKFDCKVVYPGNQGQSGETNGNESEAEVSFLHTCRSRVLGKEGHRAFTI